VRRAFVAASTVWALWVVPAEAGTAKLVRDVQESDKGGSWMTDRVVYTAAPGERNNPSVSYAAPPGSNLVDAIVSDPVGVTPGDGCRRPESDDPTVVLCNGFFGNYGGLAIDLGDGDDTYDGSTYDRWLTVEGGPGDDDIAGGSAISKLNGGPGADRLVATDSLTTLAGGPGPDVMRGTGATLVTVTYADRAAPLRIDMRPGGGDGELGEDDSVGPGISEVVGGSGDDVIVGDESPNLIESGAGDDVIHGAGGDDRIFAGGGADTIHGGDGADSLYPGRDLDALRDDRDGPNHLFGGAGDDFIAGGEAKAYIVPGPGNDFAYSNPGDLVKARDGFLDTLYCGGAGRSQGGTALADSLDFAAGCRIRRRGAAAAGMTDFHYPRRIGVACPQDMPRACAATIRIFQNGRLRGQDTVRVRQSLINEFLIRDFGAFVPTAGDRMRVVMWTRDSRGRRRVQSETFTYAFQSP
jgi:hypothetical protein